MNNLCSQHVSVVQWSKSMGQPIISRVCAEAKVTAIPGLMQLSDEILLAIIDDCHDIDPPSCSRNGETRYSSSWRTLRQVNPRLCEIVSQLMFATMHILQPMHGIRSNSYVLCRKDGRDCNTRTECRYPPEYPSTPQYIARMSDLASSSKMFTFVE